MEPRPGQATLLAGGSLWTGAGFDRADLVVRDGRIAAILPPGGAGEGGPPVVDARGCAILPPFFDGHVHSSSTLLRGTENSYPLELWSFWAIGYGRGISAASIRAALRLTAIEMIRAGIGGYVDHFPPARFIDVARAVHRDSGLRIGFAPFFADLVDEDLLDMPLDRSVIAAVAPVVPSDPAGLRRRTAALAAMADDRITPLLGPNAPQRCSPDLLSLWAGLAEAYGLGSHTHLLETYPQSRAAAARWASGAVGELDRLGLLDGRTSLAHAIWLDAPARRLLARRGATAIHNPLSNQMLGSGRMPVRAMLDDGVRLGLGTDCSNTSGRHDMFEAMRQMLVAGRDAGSRHDEWIRPEEVLRAAVEDGWAALGKGPARLVAGAPADLMVVDFRTASLAAAEISAASIVSHGDSGAVRDLMVGGRWLMRDRTIEVFDEAAVIDEAAGHAAALRDAARPLVERLRPLIGAYDRWSAGVFSGLHCPLCGRSGAPRGFAAEPAEAPSAAGTAEQ